MGGRAWKGRQGCKVTAKFGGYARQDNEIARKYVFARKAPMYHRNGMKMWRILIVALCLCLQFSKCSAALAQCTVKYSSTSALDAPQKTVDC